MSARWMGALAIVLSLGVAAATLGKGVRDGMALETPAPPPAAEVAGLTGAGDGVDYLQRLGCVACIGTIVYSGGATPLGILTVSIFRPDFVVGCATLCYMAVT